MAGWGARESGQIACSYREQCCSGHVYKEVSDEI